MFVLPSLADGFGMVVPPVMASGLPVILTRNVGAADIVTEGVDGFVVPIRDTEALKRRLLELYHDPEKVRRMSAAAVSKSRAQLSWDAYGDRLVRYLGCDTESRVPVSVATTPDRINLHPGSTLP